MKRILLSNVLCFFVIFALALIPVTLTYAQDDQYDSVSEALDYSNMVWFDYDSADGSVEWQLCTSDDKDSRIALRPEQWLDGIQGEVYDFYLTEKMTITPDYNMQSTAYGIGNMFGQRQGSKPVVYVYSHNVKNEIEVDDCGDDDDRTWHFSYSFNGSDCITMFWSAYDAFVWDERNQFQIVMNQNMHNNRGIVSLSPAPGPDDCFVSEEYGEKYNFSVDDIGKVSVTVMPQKGKMIQSIMIGGTEYINQIFKNANDVRPSFSTKQDGSYTHVFTEDEVKAYYWDENLDKQSLTDDAGNQLYASVYVGVWYLDIPKIKNKDVIYDDKTGDCFEVISASRKEVAFSGQSDKKKKTVKIPEQMTAYGVPYKVVAVGENAFMNNRYVTKVTINDNIKTIGKNAFRGAVMLEKVTLGKRLSRVGSYAFKDCKKLNTLVITSHKLTTDSVSKNAFSGITKTTTVKVPEKKLSSYKRLLKRKGLSSKVVRIVSYNRNVKK